MWKIKKITNKIQKLFSKKVLLKLQMIAKIYFTKFEIMSFFCHKL